MTESLHEGTSLLATDVTVDSVGGGRHAVNEVGGVGENDRARRPRIPAGASNARTLKVFKLEAQRSLSPSRA
jgi:hypothetical protein